MHTYTYTNMYILCLPRTAIISSRSAKSRLSLSRSERHSFIDNLLVRINLIIEMILVDRPCAMGV